MVEVCLHLVVLVLLCLRDLNLCEFDLNSQSNLQVVSVGDCDFGTGVYHL